MRSLVTFLLATALHASAAEPRRPHLQIINGSGKTVDSFWLKSDTGRVANGTITGRVANGTIAPGRETIITTTIGHRFAVGRRYDKSETIFTSEVPAKAVTELQKVPLYFSPSYQGKRGGAEFHPGAGWLKDNGRDPIRAKGVEFSGSADFEAEVNRMPNFALHELAHAYHNRVVAGSFNSPEITAAYDHARASGKYEKIERWHGNEKPNTFECAYAMTNPMEYFAENTEEYFLRNDCFPFTHEELKKHDPELFAALEKQWGIKP